MITELECVGGLKDVVGVTIPRNRLCGNGSVITLRTVSPALKIRCTIDGTEASMDLPLYIGAMTESMICSAFRHQGGQEQPWLQTPGASI